MHNEPEHALDAIGSVPICATCGSEQVVQPAAACWNTRDGLWELERCQGAPFCRVCQSKTALIWTRPDQPPVETIRALNDALRRHGQGNGQLFITRGVEENGADFTRSAIDAMRSFDAFSDNNDLHSEHDFAAFEVGDEKLFFKIDYFEPSMTAHSDNPANPGVTVRVLTLMLASEY